MMTADSRNHLRDRQRLGLGAAFLAVTAALCLVLNGAEDLHLLLGSGDRGHSSASLSSLASKPSSPDTPGKTVLESSKATRLQPPRPSEEFHMESLGPEPRGVCGYTKCFFPYEPDPSRFGYVIAQKNRREIVQSWEFGQQMRKMYGIRHLMLGPFQRHNITVKEADKLDAHLRLWTHSAEGFGDRPRRFSEGAVFVQPVLTAPQNSVLIGCVNDKKETSIPEYKALLERVQLEKRDQFRSRLGQQLNRLKLAAQAKPCLLRDFQAIVAPSGDLFLLDFDDCTHKPHPRNPEPEEAEFCLPLLDDLFNSEVDELDQLVDKYDIDV